MKLNFKKCQGIDFKFLCTDWRIILLVQRQNGFVPSAVNLKSVHKARKLMVKLQFLKTIYEVEKNVFSDFMNLYLNY
jgi:hypothetical protein